MIVGVGRETAQGERRVAIVPETVVRLEPLGIEVVVEAGAGAAAGLLDQAYAEAGARVLAAADLDREADLVVRIQKPTPAEVERLRSGQGLIGFLQPLIDPDVTRAVAERGVTAFSMDAIPRISRSQSMDALSSQATVSGYKAVLLAAGHSTKFFPMLTTAAGTIPPAKVLIIGAGVAGLQAIATARRLGAVVSGFDTRPVVREQVESLGARFIELEVEGEETAGGYATQLSEEQEERERELLGEYIADSDIVVTTAAIPGKPAPLIVPEEGVRAMRPGSVIVDLAAETGGNCALTERGEVVVREGVTIVGLLNLPSTMPAHASQMYSRNVMSLLGHLVTDGKLELDFDDQITNETCVTHAGEVRLAPVAA
ncbi:MAG: Re/Si-specific NAD(P)(+) transhydrogenase subunit alpha [Actinomycetia bacterium]|nr:Re/Si-specific NAD(P)(+) transhydrogenase subunit alpha [Actinomycetes bacterium]